jgi:serine phosphatase RsbU (regulator of sigma subunit)
VASPSDNELTELTADEAPQVDSRGALQQALLPRSAPRVDGYDLAGGTAVEPSSPGATVWSHFALEDGRTAIAALSVQSQGSPPALTLAVSRAFLTELARGTDSPDKVLAGVNDILARTAPEGLDQMAACGVLVPGTDAVQWACAGALHGGVIRRDGTFDELQSHGPPLGMLQGFQYGVSSLELGPGDEVGGFAPWETGRRSGVDGPQGNSEGRT